MCNHEICLYADDILLFLQKTHSSLSEIIPPQTEAFFSVSDHFINWAKSAFEALILNKHKHLQLTNQILNINKKRTFN